MASSHQYRLRFFTENSWNYAFDYTRQQLGRSTGGVSDAVLIIGQYAKIEADGPCGFTEEIDGIKLYLHVFGPHCIAHVQNPDDPTEIIVLTTFDAARDLSGGRDEAWRLLRKCISPIP